MPALALMAQSNVEEVEIFQSLFGMEKKEVVDSFVQLNTENKDLFWSLYDQYEAERKGLGKLRIKLLTSYADNYNTLTEDKVDEMVKESIVLSAKSLST